MRGDHETSRGALLAALAVHLALVGALLLTPLQPRPLAAPPSPPTPRAPNELPIDLTQTPEPGPSPSPAPSGPPTPALRRSSARASVPVSLPAPAPALPLALVTPIRAPPPRLGLALDDPRARANTFVASAALSSSAFLSEDPIGPRAGAASTPAMPAPASPTGPASRRRR